jgi:methionyl aminopeptidase
MGRQAPIRLKSPGEIAVIRRSSALAARALVMIADHLRAGVTTLEIDRLVHDYFVRNGAVPSTLGYHGYPKSCCTSINDVVCHGIPSRRRLRDGDIINVDVTCTLEEFHGDTSATFYVGRPSPEAHHLVEVTRKCLDLGIEQVIPGGRIGDIGAAIQAYAEAQGCSVVRDFVGHGLGRDFHEGPHVPHFGERGKGVRIEPGMTFTIEPMINLGGWELELLEDGWTAVTKDGSLSAQFEHTLLVTPAGCEILTARDRPLRFSEIGVAGWPDPVPQRPGPIS